MSPAGLKRSGVGKKKYCALIAARVSTVYRGERADVAGKIEGRSTAEQRKYGESVELSETAELVEMQNTEIMHPGEKDELGEEQLGGGETEQLSLTVLLLFTELLPFPRHLSSVELQSPLLLFSLVDILLVIVLGVLSP